jgi:hypothetical protein
MLLAAQMTFKWYKEEKQQQEEHQSAYTYETFEKPTNEEPFVDNEDSFEPLSEEPVKEKSILEQHPYLNQGFAHFKNIEPMVAPKSEPIEEPKITATAEVEYVPAVQESPIIDESEEVKKKNQYMIKESGQQIIKKKE